MNTRTPFLSGITVREVGGGIAGSAAAAMLATLGADVTKVRSADRHRAGPMIRTREGYRPAIDLTLDRDKRIVESDSDELITDGYDIVIVDHECAIDPPASDSAVVVSVSPFGLDGPRSSQPGGELVAQATGGLLATIEGPDETPVPAPGYVALKAAGAVAALAALHGLDRRNRSA